MSNTLEVATEINRQINALDYWCRAYIGAKKSIAMTHKGMDGLTYVCTKGIYVEILLDAGKDIYEVNSYKMGRGKNASVRNYKYEAVEVYVDVLADTVRKAYDNCFPDRLV
jgi:hypothetical protein